MNVKKITNHLFHPKFHIFLAFIMVVYSGYVLFQPLAIIGGVLVAISAMRMAFMDKYCDKDRVSMFESN